MVPAAVPVASGQGYTISHIDGPRPESWDFIEHPPDIDQECNIFDITGSVARTADSCVSTRKTCAPIETSGLDHPASGESTFLAEWLAAFWPGSA